MRNAFLYFAALILSLATSTAAAQIHSELSDAGELPGTSQLVTSSVISGGLGVVNDRDMYRLTLTGGQTFSAMVTSATFDTQLFLFDAFGRGVYGNDDIVGGSSSNFLSLLPSGHALTPTVGGTYYLGISQFNDDPSNPTTTLPNPFPQIPGITCGGLFLPPCQSAVTSGGLIFAGAARAIQTPTGPGGFFPISFWTDGSGAAGGTYTIALTGIETTPIPEPEAYAMLVAGLGLLGFIARRRNRLA